MGLQGEHMLENLKSRGFRSTEGHESGGVAMLRMDHPRRPDSIILTCIRAAGRPGKVGLVAPSGWTVAWSGSSAAAKDQWESRVRAMEAVEPPMIRNLERGIDSGEGIA